MKFTTVSIKEIQADKTHRLDAKYWINKKIKEIKREIKRLKKLPDYEYVIMDLEQEKKELKKNKSSSSQAGGPAHKESGSKQPG